MSKIWRFFLCALIVVACETDPYQRLAGSTMGTQYRVVARCDVAVEQARIEGVLSAVNASMSTYDERSEISNFNASPVGQWMTLSPALAHVMRAAIDLSVMSDGAFDVTVGPLVDAWGFGPTPVDTAPSAPQLDGARQRVGFRFLQLDGDRLRKTKNVSVDLSAIAKGYGVDAVAVALLENGCSDFLVDIGGEVRVVGVSPTKRKWRIGIEVPDRTTVRVAHRIVEVAGGSVATSGDYRNVIEWGGVAYSHTIDPRAGAPVRHRLASVTVVHESAMWADGYATLINVLGPQAGLEFAAARDLPVYLLVRNDDGFAPFMTPAMTGYLAPELAPES